MCNNDIIGNIGRVNLQLVSTDYSPCRQNIFPDEEFFEDFYHFSMILPLCSFVNICSKTTESKENTEINHQ